MMEGKNKLSVQFPCGYSFWIETSDRSTLLDVFGVVKVEGNTGQKMPVCPLHGKKCHEAKA